MGSNRGETGVEDGEKEGPFQKVMGRYLKRTHQAFNSGLPQTQLACLPIPRKLAITEAVSYHNNLETLSGMAHNNGHILSAPDVSERERQQDYITAALGFVLHPSIRLSLSQGTGRKTNIAVVSDMPLAAEADSSLDISWMHFPPTEILSSTGLEPELVEHFDVVVVNHVHSSLENEQWEMAIQNLADLLSPGGWVQWVDWDPITARIAGSNPGTPDASNLRDLLRRYTDALQARKVGATYRIANTLRSQGFVEIDSDLYPIAPDTGFTRVVAKGALTYLERIGDISSENARATEAKIEHEIQASGPLVWYDLWCHIARVSSKS